MRAYLIGYRHGVIIDGYMADLINQGKCEAMQDESLDVEYVPIEQVLEIIDEEQKEYRTAYEALTNVYNRVLALKGGEQE